MNLFDEADDYGEDLDADEPEARIANNEAYCDVVLQPLIEQLFHLAKEKGIPLLVALEFAPNRLVTTCDVPPETCSQLMVAAGIATGQATVQGGLIFRNPHFEPGDDAA